MSNLPQAVPAQPSPVPPRPPGRPLLGCAFALSFLLNLAAGIVIVALCTGLALRSLSSETTSLIEKTYSGPSHASNKVAIVEIDGILFEGLLGHAHKQIEQAAKDDAVKAVVLRVNSPGGSITASDDLYHRILRLRDGDADKSTPAKPVVVSMGGIAASGGYYISVPASKIFAEPITTTGSIGVYTAFPNFAKFADQHGLTMNTIKAGEIKDSTSYFHEMPPKARQMWQDLIDDSYVGFLQIVEKNRKKLTRKKLLERFDVTPLRPDPVAVPKQPAPYSRYRADGGVFTAAKAKELDLIDAVGTLDDAIKAVAKDAGLETFRAVEYHKPFSLSSLLGGQSRAASPNLLDAGRLQAAVSPRLWYLAPGYEGAGLIAASTPSR